MPPSNSHHDFIMKNTTKSSGEHQMDPCNLFSYWRPYKLPIDSSPIYCTSQSLYQQYHKSIKHSRYKQDLSYHEYQSHHYFQWYQYTQSHYYWHPYRVSTESKPKKKRRRHRKKKKEVILPLKEKLEKSIQENNKAKWVCCNCNTENWEDIKVLQCSVPYGRVKRCECLHFFCPWCQRVDIERDEF